MENPRKPLVASDGAVLNRCLTLVSRAEFVRIEEAIVRP